MKIRVKIISIVLPLLISTVLITGIISAFSARQGITRLAMKFLSFKSEELAKYTDSQWSLLESNGLSEDAGYIEITKRSVESYARSIVKGNTELIFATDGSGTIVMSTEHEDRATETGPAGIETLLPYIEKKHAGWIEFRFGREPKVGYSFSFDPLGWFIVVSDDAQAFYGEVNSIMYLNIATVTLAVLVSITLLFLFSGYLTAPLMRVASAMREVIRTNDLGRRVDVEYDDEIGDLADTFNLMSRELEAANRKIKEFAFRAVLAQKNEHKIRNIFQKYVPKDIIDSFFRNPERLLIGDNRVLAIMFSDIRSFTTTSEKFRPDELVSVLNRYFSMLVEIIMENGGIVDKYIGDAIMAFFGAPVGHDDDALRAVRTALDMQEALRSFNREQTEKGRPPFPTGIGLNYGIVTVGNIGSEKKMDYTVIGDMVNLASRLESLTKQYKQEFIFSRSVYEQVKDRYLCRYLDKVVVKGKTTGEKIYTTKKDPGDAEKYGWAAYHSGFKAYLERDFRKAAGYFGKALSILPGDKPAEIMLSRCAEFVRTPPSEDWDGSSVLHEK